MTKKYKDEQWLRDQYVGTTNSLNDLSDNCSVTSETVRQYLHEYGIDIKPKFITKSNDCKELHKTKDWIRSEYVENRRTQSDLADECGCSEKAIRKGVEFYGFNVRSQSEQKLECARKHKSEDWMRKMYYDQELSIDDIAEQCGCSDSVIERRIDELGLQRNIEVSCAGDHRDKEWLVEKYHIENLKMDDMAELCGCQQTLISDWMQKHNIDTDDGLFKSGEDHWNYKHGESVRGQLDFRKRDKWIKFSQQQKEKCDWTCEYCETTGGQLHTHHVEPLSMGGDRWENEFVVLCRDCHINNYELWHPPQLENYI